MNSLEWRTRKLENKIYGYAGANVRRTIPQNVDTIVEQLSRVASLYDEHTQKDSDKHVKFLEMYKANKDLLSNLENERDSNISERSKAELVLAYEDDLTKHLETVKAISEKADRVLDVKKWPDFRGYTERLEKLQTITKDQHLQSMKLDKRTEDLIEVYNDIISSFRNNIAIWNQKLDAIESEEKNADEDV